MRQPLIMASKRTAPKPVVAVEREDDNSKSLKRRRLMREQNARGLSKSMVAYARAGEQEPNVIIRSTEDARFTAFGVTGFENLRRVFYGMLALLERNRDLFMERSKFGVQGLVTLLDKLSVEDREEMDNFVLSDGDDSLLINSNVSIRVSEGDVPQLALLKYGTGEDGERDIQAGIYLFASELVKLIKHINASHQLSDTLFGNCGGDSSKKFNELTDAELLL